MFTNTTTNDNSNYYNYANYRSSPINFNNQLVAIEDVYSNNNGVYESSSYNQNTYYNSEYHDSISSSNSSNTSIVHKQTTPKLPATQTKTSSRRPGLHHQALPKEAVDQLNYWFDSHINHPYPTTEEKSVIANKCGLSVKQVNSWFCNRRNRSENTKPKRVKRQLQTEISSVFNEFSSNASQTKTIEKLYSLLL